MLPSVVLWWILQLSSAAIFVAVQPTFRYADGIYHCIVTASTVGYGDTPLTTQAARLWAACHILVSVSWLAALFADIEELRRVRFAQLQRAALLLSLIHI